jgi:hypothetical protein
MNDVVEVVGKLDALIDQVAVISEENSASTEQISVSCLLVVEQSDLLVTETQEMDRVWVRLSRGTRKRSRISPVSGRAGAAETSVRDKPRRRLLSPYDNERAGFLRGFRAANVGIPTNYNLSERPPGSLPLKRRKPPRLSAWGLLLESRV